MNRIRIACSLAAFALALGAGATEIDSDTFGGIEARAIGPAVMSGRVAALAVVPEDPVTVYVGAASGGVWKSTDGGVTFRPVFDDHTQSIGALAVDPSNPQTVWVGTGESWVRNSVSAGDGVYKSDDGGASWRHVGLADSERIARIVVHPGDPDTVYVCATGHLWDANPERGLYRTRDGGESWEAVLQIDDDTGCSDVAIDPQDPRVLYAGMWQFRRLPWTFDSGGPGSGLYKTTDGGDSWSELTDGLPAGEKGRVAVAVAPSRPRTVYAVVEADETALYRSDDLGASWRKTSTAFDVQARPFYFAYVVVDPVDPERVYKPGLGLSMSDDGGATFQQLGNSTHSDHHALWIDPRNPQHLVLGTDGGIYLSHDRGSHFRFSLDLPLSQFYEVSYDLEEPYNVYGGLQDNGSWMGPSRSPGGINAKDWDNLGFGDGFHVHVDPAEPDFVYLEWQGGNVLRVDKRTGETRDVKPLPDAGEPDFRYNWNTPIHLSPSVPGRVYVGSQFLFRSEDRGASWKRISPDLTTDDPAKQQQATSGGLTIDNSTAENHCTIFTVSESPLDPQEVWVGTDDGRLQVTRDGGETWADVTANLPGVPEGTWVSHVAAGRHAAGTAYAALDGHRTGDMATYLFRTEDHGATWTPMTGDALEGWAHVILEDVESPDLLFAGTERGLFISIDRGASWARFAGNLPPVPVNDLALHPREHDLVIGTHGRGIYILDDVTPLRHLTPEVLDSKVAFVPTRPGTMSVPSASFGFSGDGEYTGSNPPEATIAFYQARRHVFGDLKLEIYGSDGELVSSLPAPKRKGINRVSWSMRLPPPKMPPATALVVQPFVFFGPRVPLDTYTVRLVKGKETLETQFPIEVDPRSDHSAEDRALQHETLTAIYRGLGDLTYLVDAISELEEGAEARAGELASGDRLAHRLKNMASSLGMLRSDLVSTNEAGWLSGEEKLREHLGWLYGGVNGYDGRPTDSQLRRFDRLSAELGAARQRFAELTAELPRLNQDLERREMERLEVLGREAWDERSGASSATGAAVAPADALKLWNRYAPALEAFTTTPLR